MFNLSCERPHHFEVSLCKWQLAWCQQTATVRVTIILPSSAVVWNQHLPHTAVCCRGEVVQDKYNTAAPLYSSFLANKLNMRKVYQQYVLYMAGVAMTVSMATRFTRACNLIRYVNYSKRGRQPEADNAAWMAQAQPHDLERAERIISRFRSANVSAAFAFSMLWMAPAVLAIVGEYSFDKTLNNVSRSMSGSSWLA